MPTEVQTEMCCETKMLTGDIFKKIIPSHPPHTPHPKNNWGAESDPGVSIWLKLSEIMSSPPLHLTTSPPLLFLLPVLHLLSIDWLLLHHTGDPVERSFSLYKEKMQLGRL